MPGVPTRNICNTNHEGSPFRWEHIWMHLFLEDVHIAELCRKFQLSSKMLGSLCRLPAAHCFPVQHWLLRMGCSANTHQSLLLLLLLHKAGDSMQG